MQTCGQHASLLIMKTRDKFNPMANANNLPPELLRELKLSSAVEDRILEVFREGGGILNVSEILVGFYRLYNEVKTRRNMTATLYRMKQKGLLRPTGKKGEYSIGELGETEKEGESSIEE